MTTVPRVDPADAQAVQDMLDVFMYKTKPLDSFTADYQTKLRNMWRFYGQKSYTGDQDSTANMTANTIDIV